MFINQATAEIWPPLAAFNALPNLVCQGGNSQHKDKEQGGAACLALSKYNKNK